jgi:hypothetical protein
MTRPRPAMSERKPREGTLCADCGHRFAVHAGVPDSACVRYERGHRCACRKFVMPTRVARLALIPIVGALALLAGCGGSDTAIEPEVAVRSVLEQQFPMVDITDVRCVEESDLRWECAVTVAENGVEETVAGTFTCEGTGSDDQCIWRGELRGG